MNFYLSWKYLGEKFVFKYDGTAMILITGGTLLIVLMSNKEQQTFTTERIIHLLIEMRSLLYFAATIALGIVHNWLVPVLLKNLRAFETDCELWEVQNAPKKILPVKIMA